MSSIAPTLVYVGNADTQSISVFELGTTGKLTARESVALQSSAQPGRSVLLAVSPDRRFLYGSYLHDSRSRVAAYAIDVNTGALAKVAESTELADTMAYIVTDRTGRFLLSASYAGNKVTVNRILPSGAVGDMLQIVDTEPKAHCILPHPDNRHVLYTSLGGDRIYQSRFDHDTGLLSPGAPPWVGVPANAGPRFLTYSNDGRFVYAIDELDGAVHGFEFDAAAGCLGTEIPVNSALPPGFSGKAWGADIHLTPDGHFLYTSERTSSTITAFRVDAQRGNLTPLGSFPTVTQPRAFAIDPTGKYLLAAGQLSNSVMSHSIDGTSGQLTAIEERPVGKNPTWVEILSLGPR